MEEIRLYLRRILFMIQKELIATLKDKKSRLVLLMPVLVQTLAFGYVATYNLDKVQYAVLDQNRSRYSAELLSKIDGSPVFTRAATLETTQGMATWIDSGKVSAVLVIPPDFDRRILSGSAAPVQVITDGRNTMISG
ncbi:MAG: ABC transporter permease, partial [Dialister sp.]|nr:ABC transporter permease [Dialister sp.]